MTDTAQKTLSLRLERTLDAPVDTVWRWLTDPELRRRWFMAGPIDAREGGTIGFSIDHDNLSDAPAPPYPDRFASMRGKSFEETILAYDPPSRLSFTWSGGREGTVTFELTGEGERTHLTLTHVGITGPGPRANFGGGWTSHLAVLEARLGGRAVPDFWAIHAQSEAAFRDGA